MTPAIPMQQFPPPPNPPEDAILGRRAETQREGRSPTLRQRVLCDRNRASHGKVKEIVSENEGDFLGKKNLKFV
jgi:hypothetical protein